MLAPDLALRIGTVAILLLVGSAMLRDWRRTESGPFGGLLALSVAADTAMSIASLDAVPWLWPIKMVGMGVPGLLWIWTGAVFVDEFRASWRDGAAWAILPVVGMIGRQAWRPWIGGAEQALALLFIVLAAWRLLAGLRGDLLERRRRLRFVLALLAVLYAGAIVLADTFGHGHPMSAASRTLEAAALAALAAAFALYGLRVGRPLSAPPAVEAAAPLPSAVPEPASAGEDRDGVLLARLRQLMGEDRLYRQEGFGLAALASAMEVPEYRLRELINQRLGHRNFTSFVNEYRLADAIGALADPGQADVPILTIALDAGFQSIGPFNRAFKAHTGMTPTAYRKQAESRNR